MFIHEKSIEVRRDLPEVWNFIINHEDWIKWLLKKEIKLNGPMAEGMTGVLIGDNQKGKQEFGFVIDKIREQDYFSIAVNVAWLKIRFYYCVKEIERGTELKQKVELTGFLSIIISWLFKKPVKKYCRSVLSDAKKIIESN